MIHNDHKKNTTALITLDRNKTIEWIKKENISSKEHILQKLKEEMLLFNSQSEFKNKFPKKWIPNSFQIIAENFSEENKMINSTLKMVRHRITETYQERLDLMYGVNAQKSGLEENKKVVSKIFKI